jgi:hypothetical protein
MEGIGAMAFGSAYIMGWGAADIGRFADKLITKQ